MNICGFIYIYIIYVYVYILFLDLSLKERKNERWWRRSLVEIETKVEEETEKRKEKWNKWGEWREKEIAKKWIILLSFFQNVFFFEAWLGKRGTKNVSILSSYDMMALNSFRPIYLYRNFIYETNRELCHRLFLPLHCSTLCTYIHTCISSPIKITRRFNEWSKKKPRIKRFEFRKRANAKCIWGYYMCVPIYKYFLSLFYFFDSKTNRSIYKYLITNCKQSRYI